MEKRDLTVELIYKIMVKYYGFHFKVQDRPQKLGSYYRDMMVYIARYWGASMGSINGYLGSKNKYYRLSQVYDLHSKIQTDGRERRDYEAIMKRCEEILNF